MRSKRIPAEEQYRLIMECRQSGLTDHQWCVDEYSCAVTPQVRQTGNRLSGLAGTAYASLLT